MPNSRSAEPLAEVQGNPDEDSNPLTQQEEQPENVNQPHLGIVHSSYRLRDPSVNMAAPDRLRPASEKPPAMLDRAVQAQIGRLLRAAFADVASEPVPERFVALLAQLEAKEKAQ